MQKTGAMRRNSPDRWLPPLLIILAGVLAYWNSFDGVFLYDDIESIRDNPHIRQLWPLSEAMSLPLWGGGMTLDGRPLLSLSLALNRHFFGPEPWGYHLVNLVIHIGAGLLLFGVVRRTLELPWFRERYERSGTWLAFAIAAIWLVHPLQTGSVTYIVQRAESLMGMLFLLTVYCAVRGFGVQESGVRSQESGSSPGPSSGRGQTGAGAEDGAALPGGTGFWYLAAILACAAGMGVKEVMFSAPLVVLLYDVIFVSESLRAALVKRWRLYVGLFSTWLILFGIMALRGGEATRDFVEISPLRYLLTQPRVILHYLRLTFWPSPLVLEYGWPLEEQWPRIVFPGLAILGLLAVTLRGLWLRKWYGFVLGWFFLCLALTSSIAPLAQVIFEHRMYLALAAVVMLVVIGAEYAVRRVCLAFKTFRVAPGRPGPRACPASWRSLWCRAGAGAETAPRYSRQCAVLGGVLTTAAVIVLGCRTHDRNRDYHSALGMWRQNVANAPQSSAAHNDLGLALHESGRSADALAYFQRATQIKPGYPEAHRNWGLALQALARHRDAIAQFQRALEVRPEMANAYLDIGNSLQALGHTPEALEYFRQALRIKPDFAKAQNNLGHALLLLGMPRDAIEHYREALRIDPDHPEPHYGWGLALDALGNRRDAIRYFEEALRLDPDHAAAREGLREMREMLGERGESD